MRKSLYKSLVAMLMSAIVMTTNVSPVCAAAVTLSETDTEKSGGTTEEEKQKKAVITSLYQDKNGVSYDWFGYEDGTAMIYDMSCERDTIVLDIPSYIDGYKVTVLGGQFKWKTFESVTIPESIQYLSNRVFEYCTIKKLYYNAKEADCDNDFGKTPFGYAKINEIIFGRDVEQIGDYIFYSTSFYQDEIRLCVPVIGTYAFHSANFNTLTLTNDIKSISKRAFERAKFEALHYNCADAVLDKADDLLSSPFCGAVIHELDFSEDVKAVPDYCFAQAHFKMKEYTITVEKIGDFAFFGTWDSTGLWLGTDIIDKLTISDSVKYIGKEAFANCYINELVFNATVESSSTFNLDGVFYLTDIHKLTIGNDVRKIPDYLFSNADFMFNELVLSVPSIGANSFYNVWCPYDNDTPKGRLTVTDKVNELGANAFAENEFEELQFESNATTGAYNSVTGVFYEADIYKLSIGENASMIQPYLFSNTEFHDIEELSINVPVGKAAFYSSSEYKGGFNKVTFGEGVTSIGNYAFCQRSLGNVTYNAVNAETFVTETEESPFNHCTLNRLTIGDKVEKLNKGIFAGILINQDQLVIPDSVNEIGGLAFYISTYRDDDMAFKKLLIGKGLKKLDYKAFAYMNFEDIYVEALNSDDAYDTKIDSSYYSLLPGCQTLHMHHDSSFFSYFEKNAAKIELTCDDYMVSSVGEEYFDSEGKQFIRPVYETCSVCGYTKTDSNKERAYSVTFVADNKVLDTRYCKKNGTVTAPDVPDIKGYEFIKWDTDFSSVAEDLTVKAVYEQLAVASPEPTEEPVAEPTPEATAGPIPEATSEPTVKPAIKPESTAKPTAKPTVKPTVKPRPTAKPVNKPTVKPEPTVKPAIKPTMKPTLKPTSTPKPTLNPNSTPSRKPKKTTNPTINPTNKPKPKSILIPMQKPTTKPIHKATARPATKPTPEPTTKPNKVINNDSKPAMTPVPTFEAKTESKEPLPVAVSLLIGLSGAGGVFLLFFFRIRKVRGTVVDADGMPVSDIHVTLDNRETITNKNGEFVFRGMKRGNHDFIIYNSSDSIVLSICICTEKTEDSQVFYIMKNSCLDVDAHKEGKNYLIDVVVTS